jgi:hypothetical protein
MPIEPLTQQQSWVRGRKAFLPSPSLAEGGGMKAGWKPPFTWLPTIYSALGVPGACIVAPVLLARTHFVEMRALDHFPQQCGKMAPAGASVTIQATPKCGLNPLWASRVRALVGAPHDFGFLMSGLVPHALNKMVCTHHFTFQIYLNERSLPNAS